ncbi:MAG: regulatory domain of in-like proprotein convertase [Pedosphaera sp.]|nr:regulatory domain of in-like proprotein convertase [Pedosphaera sp.]
MSIPSSFHRIGLLLFIASACLCSHAQTTQPASEITATGALLNGSINPDGTDSDVYFQYGLTTNYNNFTGTNHLDAGTNLIAITNILGGLFPGTTYHFQIVAFNGALTNSGEDLTFTTLPLPPVATTEAASAVTATGAILNGWVKPNGAATRAFFQYGLTTNYGNFTATNNLDSNIDATIVTNAVTNLFPGVTYHFQLVASNSAGIDAGTDIAFTPEAFTSINAGLPGILDGSVTWADYDNDGQLDALLLGIDSNGDGVSRLLHNQGNGNFTNINVGLPPVFHGSVAWGDYDNDGRLDILLTGIEANNYNYTSQIWRNLGNGTFTNIHAGLPPVYLGSAVWGDYDNDGRLDILLTGHDETDGISQIWRNLGNGTFTNINVPLPGVYRGFATWGDYDNDGKLDILLIGGSGSGPISQIWRNLGNGTFTNINALLPGVVAGSAAWGDYDNDGKLDILLTGLLSDSGTPISQVWRNLGDSTFTNINVSLPGVYYSSAAWGDYDNDGKLDILLTGLLSDGVTRVAQVWRNLGNDAFTNMNLSLPGVAKSSIAWGDYNNDGRLDFLLVGESSSGAIAQMCQNNSSLTNTPPTAPTGLATSVTGDGVLLSWDPASDAQTPAGGLSYNLRVSATPGGLDMLSPLADLGGGIRRLPQLGNAQKCHTAILTNLVAGKTYFWSVQAVDTAFAGSPFAAEETFSIGPLEAPSIVSYGCQSDGLFQLQFNGMAGMNYTLQASTDMLEWTSLTNLHASSNAVFQFSDGAATNHSKRFYRLSIP